MKRFYLLLFVSCNEVETLKVYNADPTINIGSHSDGSVLIEGNSYNFFAIASDANDANSDLSVTWFLGSREICAQTLVDASGESQCSAIPQAGEEELRAIVQDPKGASGDDAISIVIHENQAPVVELQEPNSLLFQDQLQIFYAHISDDRSDPDTLRIWWESSTEGVLDAQDYIDAQGFVESVLNLGQGEHLLRLYAEDEQGSVGSDSIVVSVLDSNTAPNCSISSPENESEQSSTETILFSANATDNESSATALVARISSNLDGLVYEGTPDPSGLIYQDLGTMNAGNHILTLQVEDPYGAQCSASVSIQVGIEPDIQWITPTGGSIENEGDVLLQVLGSDAEDGPENLSIRMESSLDGALTTGLSDSNGLYSFNTSALSVGTHVLSATVTDSSNLSSTIATSLTINGLPSSPLLGLTPSNPTTESDIQVFASESIDPEGTNISYSYAWFQNSNQIVSTSDTLSHTHTNKGEQWTVRVTPSDGLGEGSYTEESVFIENTPPSITSASFSTSTPQASDTITASLSTYDADGDAVSISYAWSINGNNVSTSNTLSGSFVRGDDISLTLTPSDNQDTGSDYTLGPISIQNTPPTAPIAEVSPSTPIEGLDDLLCVVDTPSYDADGDTVQYTYEWTVNGIPYTGAITTFETGDTVPGSDTIASEDWSCTITPSDGIDSGASNTATVSISAPTGCPSGFSLAFDITDDSSDQMSNGCDWLWYNLFSLGTQISLEWWGSGGQHYGPSTWDLAADMSSIESNYLGCSSSYGSNYNMPSSDGSFYMTLVQYNDLLHIHPYGDPAEDGTTFYYGRISPGYSQDDEIYAVGYSDWSLAWQNRYESGDRFRACYAP